MNYRDNDTAVRANDTAVRANDTAVRNDDAGFLPDDRMEALRDRWERIQGGFVDDPRAAVRDAHATVSQLADELTQIFTRERTTLEERWNNDGEPDTESLRVALQRYRSFFNRLLGSTATVGTSQA